jgi:hypothetical protein
LLFADSESGLRALHTPDAVDDIYKFQFDMFDRYLIYFLIWVQELPSVPPLSEVK